MSAAFQLSPAHIAAAQRPKQSNNTKPFPDVVLDKMIVHASERRQGFEGMTSCDI
jgi:hypothetical protein